jgi:hypothetical protein
MSRRISGRRCEARLPNGRRCRGAAMNGTAEALCAPHANLAPHPRRGGRAKHGFFATGGAKQLAWVGREAPADVVRMGGLEAMAEPDIKVRPREIDLHPLAPGEVDVDTAIAGLTHKMEIIDQLIFEARARDLDVVRLLELYTLATSRLARMVRDRLATTTGDTDLDRLIASALDYAQAQEEGTE